MFGNRQLTKEEQRLFQEDMNKLKNISSSDIANTVGLGFGRGMSTGLRKIPTLLNIINDSKYGKSFLEWLKKIGFNKTQPIITPPGGRFYAPVAADEAIESINRVVPRGVAKEINRPNALKMFLSNVDRDIMRSNPYAVGGAIGTMAGIGSMVGGAIGDKYHSKNVSNEIANNNQVQNVNMNPTGDINDPRSQMINAQRSLLNSRNVPMSARKRSIQEQNALLNSQQINNNSLDASTIQNLGPNADRYLDINGDRIKQMQNAANALNQVMGYTNQSGINNAAAQQIHQALQKHAMRQQQPVQQQTPVAPGRRNAALAALYGGRYQDEINPLNGQAFYTQ